MKKPKFVTGEEAAAMIKDDSTIATIGMTLVSASETILKAIEKRFLETGSPNHLTLVHSCGQSISHMKKCCTVSSEDTGVCSHV